MYKVILILDKFFLKYERRGQINLPPWKTTLKKPSLIRVFPPWLLYIYISLYISLYVYIERYIEIYRYIVITVEKTIYLNEKYFRLTLLSILYQYIYIYIYIYYFTLMWSINSWNDRCISNQLFQLGPYIEWDNHIFLNLAKEKNMIAENLVSFKSQFGKSWIVLLYKTNTTWFILD